VNNLFILCFIPHICICFFFLLPLFPPLSWDTCFVIATPLVYLFCHQVVNNLSAEISSFNCLPQPIAGSNSVTYNFSEIATFQMMGNQANPNEQRSNTVSLSAGSFDPLVSDRLQSQDSFGMWVNHIMSDSPCSVDDPALESPVSSVHEPYLSPVVDGQQISQPEQVFTITDVSPTWVSSSEKSKVSFSLLVYLLDIN